MGKVTWFFKVVVMRDRTFFQTWSVEGEGYLQSGASVNVYSILTDRYWNGF